MSAVGRLADAVPLPCTDALLRPWTGRPVHLFLLWSRARPEQERILADLRSRFRVLDLVEVSWTPGEQFATSLTRLYGAALPPGSDKEEHCGTGPFLLVVVQDLAPRYRLRRTTRGVSVLNSTVFDARLRYRGWTGGGYRVHASDTVLETEQNLLLLLGEGAREVLGRTPNGDAVRRHDADPVGTGSWPSRRQLERTLEVFYAPRSAASDGQTLVVDAFDPWWAEQVVGGLEVGPGVREVDAEGGSLRVHVRDASARRAARLRTAVRAARG